MSIDKMTPVKTRRHFVRLRGYQYPDVQLLSFREFRGETLCLFRVAFDSGSSERLLLALSEAVVRDKLRAEVTPLVFREKSPEVR